MSQIELEFAELHTPLFFLGKNFGPKLDIAKFSEIKLVYDRTERELLVHWGKRVAIIPREAVACMIPQGDEPVKRPVNIVHPMVAGLASAQVSTPMGHVQAGPGHGKSGKDK